MMTGAEMTKAVPEVLEETPTAHPVAVMQLALACATVDFFA
jgi:hypothetical protein